MEADGDSSIIESMVKRGCDASLRTGQEKERKDLNKKKGRWRNRGRGRLIV